MANYWRDILISDARTGKPIRVVRVNSDCPISKSAAIHEVIKQEDRNGK